MSHFEYIANIEIPAKVIDELTINAPLWDAFTVRQTFPGSPHRNTKTIPLRGASSFLRSYMPKAKRKRTPYAAQLPHTEALVNSVLARMNVATVGNVLIVALAPGAEVLPHVDEGAYPDHFERFHIVLTSPPGNWFKVADEYTMPQPGDVFFFNHRLTHSVGNPGDKPRVHIIVDVTLKE
jgi:hypothetical protein